METVVASTKKEFISSLLAEGVSEDAAELLAAIHAPRRHESRVQATLARAVEACLEFGINPALGTPATLAALMLDWFGTGGPGDLGAGDWALLLRTEDDEHREKFFEASPGSSDRLAPFRGLGKGRWQASDGGAYRAALAEAIRRTHKEVGGGPCFWEVEDDALVLCVRPLNSDEADVTVRIASCAGAAAASAALSILKNLATQALESGHAESLVRVGRAMSLWLETINAAKRGVS